MCAVFSDSDIDYPAGSHLKGNHFLNVLYILTNDKSEWMDEFTQKLKHSHGWKILTSNDIVFGDSQEKDVGMAVDMDLARRAAMFMGNGVSRRLVYSSVNLRLRFSNLLLVEFVHQ